MTEIKNNQKRGQTWIPASAGMTAPRKSKFKRRERAWIPSSDGMTAPFCHPAPYFCRPRGGGDPGLYSAFRIIKKST